MGSYQDTAKRKLRFGIEPCKKRHCSRLWYPPLHRTQERGTHFIVDASRTQRLGHPPLRYAFAAKTIGSVPSVPVLCVLLVFVRPGPPYLPLRNIVLESLEKDI